jgi:hypothetical protein
MSGGNPAHMSFIDPQLSCGSSLGAVRRFVAKSVSLDVDAKDLGRSDLWTPRFPPHGFTAQLGCPNTPQTRKLLLKLRNATTEYLEGHWTQALVRFVEQRGRR